MGKIERGIIIRRNVSDWVLTDSEYLLARMRGRYKRSAATTHSREVVNTFACKAPRAHIEASREYRRLPTEPKMDSANS